MWFGPDTSCTMFDIVYVIARIVFVHIKTYKSICPHPEKSEITRQLRIPFCIHSTTSGISDFWNVLVPIWEESFVQAPLLTKLWSCTTSIMSHSSSVGAGLFWLASKLYSIYKLSATISTLFCRELNDYWIIIFVCTSWVLVMICSNVSS